MSAFGPRGQIGECQRCGDELPAAQLVKDGRNPQLLVCPHCYDPPHPAELPFKPKQVEGKARFPVAPELLPAGGPDDPGAIDSDGSAGDGGSLVAIPGVGIVPALILTGELVVLTVHLTWTPASPASARITQYEVFRDGVLLDTIETEYDDFGALETELEHDDSPVAGTYAYRIEALGGTGHRAVSNTVTMIVPS